MSARVLLMVAALTCGLAQATPDLTGIWAITAPVKQLKTSQGEAPPLKPEAQAVYDAHKAQVAKGDYSFDGVMHCLPPGLPRLLLMKEPFEILQRGKILYFVHQVNRLPRRVYLDEKLPEEPDPHYLGHSVAHWEKDTLVIETIGFSDKTFLDSAGMPHSEQLRLTERYELRNKGSRLHASFLIEDPATFMHSWMTQADFVKRPGYEIPEEVCAAQTEAERPRT